MTQDTFVVTVSQIYMHLGMVVFAMPVTEAKPKVGGDMIKKLINLYIHVDAKKWGVT